MSETTAGWKVLSIGAVTSKPSKIDPSLTGRDSVRYVDIGQLGGPAGCLQTAPLIQSATAPSRCRQQVREGDTLFSTVRPYLRKIARVGKSLDGDFASTGFSVLRPLDFMDARFLHYFTLSHDFEAQILPKQKGVSYPAVLDREVRSCEITFPELQEQRRIVEILEDHLSHLDAAEHSVLEVRRRSECLLDNFLKYELPRIDRRAQTPLGDVADTKLGKMLDSKRADGRATRYLANINVRWGYFNLDQLKCVRLTENEVQRFSLRPGDLIVCEGGEPGRSALWTRHDNDICYQKALHRVRVNDPNQLSPQYLSLALREAVVSNRVDHLFTGTTIRHLPQQQLRRVTVPLPDLESQNRLVKKAHEITDASQLLNSTLSVACRRAAGLRSAVLAAAFSGKLTGRNTDREVIEELAQ